MNFDRRRFLGAIVAGTAGAVLAPPAFGPTAAFAAVRSGETPALLPEAMAALQAHAASIPHRNVIGIVDFSSPSRAMRFDIVDVVGGRILGRHLVSHGRGSDPANSGWVQRFSNTPGSNASSSGSFLTGQVYYGRHGRSRRLIGLDAKNNRALERNIVIHGASYVSPDMAENAGRIGRSQGCFAVSTREIGQVLELLGPGRLLFAAR
jgi:hypothetical protein